MLTQAQKCKRAKEIGHCIASEPNEFMIFCTECGTFEAVCLIEDALVPTKKSSQAGPRIYYDCGSNEPCYLYRTYQEGAAMSDRVYLLLDVAEGKADHVAGKLRSIDGIRTADVIEGQPDVIAVVEAPERHRVAEITMRVISSVENMIEDLQLLPARDGIGRHDSIEPSHRDKKSRVKLEYA